MSRRSTGGRIRALFFLLISLAAAVIASIVIFVVFTAYSRELEAVEEQDRNSTTTVMVAKEDLGQGIPIHEELLTNVSFPPEFVPDDVLRQPEQAIGRVPRERILANEFIRRERLAPAEAGEGITAIIPRGMRAIAINISDGSAVSGFLNPGNYVDIIVTIRGDDENDATTRTLLQAVTVLAVNNRVGNGRISTDRNYKPSVTLALTPELVEKLTHAVNEESVTLTLRNDIDVTNVETHGEVTNELLGGKGEEGEAKRITIREWKKQTSQSKSRTITLIRGDESTVETVKE